MKVIAGLKSRFAKVDGETIGNEIDRLVGELNTARNLALREDAHRGVDDTLAVEAERFSNRMAERAGALRAPDQLRLELLQELAIGWAVSTPGFADAVHAAIDADARFSDVTVAERAATVAQLEREIGELEAELLRRELEVETAAREVEIQAKVAAIASKASGE